MESRRKILWDPPTSWEAADNPDDGANHHHADVGHAAHVEKKADFIELMFDLLFVIVIARIAEMSSEGILASLSPSELRASENRLYHNCIDESAAAPLLTPRA